MSKVWVEIYHRLKTRLRCDLGTQTQSKCSRRFQRVDHMKIVCPRLRKILPGMRAGIGSHIPLNPVGRRTVGIMALQRFLIVLPFVPKELTEFVDRG